MHKTKPKIELHVYGKSSYWKWNFFIALLPFILYGVPIHALVNTSKSRKNESIKSWFLSVRGSSFCYGFISLLLFLLSLSLNVTMCYYFWGIFYELIIQGIITPNLVTNGTHIVLYLPFLALVDYLWIFGYSLRRTLRSFDDSLNFTRFNFGEPTDIVPSYRKNLCFMYFLIVCIIVLNIFLTLHRVQRQDWSTETILRHSANYAVVVLYCCFLPIYACLCWGIRYQLQLVAGYIDSLIRKKVRLSHKHLPVLKGCYRRAVDNIIYVNTLCSLTVSWILMAIAVYVSLEASDVGMYLSGVVMKFLNRAPTESPVREVVFTPDLVRYFVGQIINFSLYLALIMYTVWQAVMTNDEARYFHVWLNDFASEVPQQEGYEPDVPTPKILHSLETGTNEAWPAKHHDPVTHPCIEVPSDGLQRPSLNGSRYKDATSVYLEKVEHRGAQERMSINKGRGKFKKNLLAILFWFTTVSPKNFQVGEEIRGDK
ncbi:unnamed protein product [Allacma fusca]|uniref:Uncharacterized protein n=1 Tax=Allacma fusca TaxID=39272 RepID=A0A8J2JPK3_9HEXA|nr:unnamed protein product [Allacma fusca]